MDTKTDPQTAQRRHDGPPPCILCGMCARIALRRQEAHLCLWYQRYLRQEEAVDASSAVRRACLRDGNNFTWRIKGVGPVDTLDYVMRRTDWHLQRTATASAYTVGRAGLVVAIGALIISLASVVIHAMI